MKLALRSAVFGLLLVAAACGSDGNKSDETAADDPTPSAEATPEPTAQPTEEAAGPDLTEESFLQAGYDLSPFPITGYPSGTIAPGRAHLPDADAAVYDFDDETGQFVPRPS